jgi:2-hydroxychromene-2-carboxylate isomerase
MPQTIDYYFWMNSDWAYLGADRLEDVAARHGVSIRYLPVDLPAVYARTGGVILPKRAPERQAYPTPRFMCPDAGLASRVVIAADAAGVHVAPLYKAILAAEWCDEQDISDASTLRAILLSQGLDADTLLRLAETTAVQAAYVRNTDAAVAAGVFGSPSYVLDGELFWGQDRLDFLELALQ